jgi:hypothetical protein
LWLPQGAWAINHDLTIPANVQLWIPTGTTVTIADGQTLTLAGCPRIEAPGWLQPGTTGKVSITAPGCTVEVHKFSTGGAGTDPTLPPPAIASPWTGWDTALNGAMTGNMYIAPTPGDNFPVFTPSANPVAPVTIGSYANITFAAGHTQLMAFIPQGDQRIVLLQAGSGLGPSYVPIGSMSAGFLLALSGTYVAD